MSIASELQTLNDNILDAYSAVNTKGGTVPANKNMANLAAAIATIAGGGGGSVDISNFFGFTKAVSGTFSVTDSSYEIYTVTHNLGVAPKFVIFTSDSVERGGTRFIVGGYVLQTGTMLSGGLMSSGVHIGGGYVVGRTQDSATSNGAYANMSTTQNKTSSVYDLYGNSSGSSATPFMANTTTVRLTAKWSSYTCVFSPNTTYYYLIAA